MASFARIGTALLWLALTFPAGAAELFEDGQAVEARRPDGRWQKAMIDGPPAERQGKIEYPVQFLEEPYGAFELPAGAVRLDAKEGTLDQQLARAFPEIPKWTEVLLRREDGGDGTEWAVVTRQSGIFIKVSLRDRNGRRKIRHSDIVANGRVLSANHFLVEEVGDILLDAVLGIRHRQDENCKLSSGYTVKAQDRDDGRWYRAQILRKDGCSYKIRWEDGADYDEFRDGKGLLRN